MRSERKGARELRMRGARGNESRDTSVPVAGGEKSLYYRNMDGAMLGPMTRLLSWLGSVIAVVAMAAPSSAASLAGAPVSEDSIGAALRYQDPPPAIRKVLDAPALPIFSVSPTCDGVLLLRGNPYPPIADLAKPM